MRVLFVTVSPVLRLDVGNDFPIPAIGSDVVIKDVFYTVTSHVWGGRDHDAVIELEHRRHPPQGAVAMEHESLLPRVDEFMSDTDLTVAAERIKDSIDWSKLPQLAEIFQSRPSTDRYWHELVALTLTSLEQNGPALNARNARKHP